MKKINSVLLSVLYFILTALILCIPAFYNQYVMLYSDSLLYLEQSIRLIPTVDRPIGYAYFIRATTWQSTMWMVIFFQGLIASLLIYHTLKTVLINTVFKKVYHFFAICLLTFFTTVGWYVSLLMPDIFTSFLILAVFNTLFGRNNLIKYIFYSTVIIFAILSHSSNIPILALILIVTWLILLLSKRFAEIRKKALAGSIIIFAVFVCTLVYLVKYNYDHFHKAQLSTTTGIFFFARLIDTGIIESYTKENCDQKELRICMYKDSIPKSSQDFLWNVNGIFYKMGGWSNYQEESKLIVKDILFTPKYYGTILSDFSLSTFKQLTKFQLGGDLLNSQTEQWLPVYESAKKYFPRNEIKREYYDSRQFKEKMGFEFFNSVLYFVVFCSLMIIAFVLYRYKIENKMFLLLAIVFSGVFFNAAVCANLSNIINRYQARVIWLIPFMAFIIFLNYIFPKIFALLKK